MSKQFFETLTAEVCGNARVGVYRNLHNNHFSVINPKTRTVIYHANNIVLSDVVFHVRTGGWKNVFETGVKNVHAFVYGTICKERLDIDKDLKLVTYRPKVSMFFFCPQISEEPENSKIFSSEYAKMINGKIIMAKI